MAAGCHLADLALVEPSLERLPGYVTALEARWSPSTTRDVSLEQLAAIRRDVAAFMQDLTRRQGGTITLGDGREVPRLPGRTLWVWDGSFCGSINVRHVPGTEELPAHCSGHVGYAVVPWKQRRGYATRALALLLPVAHEMGMSRALITCDEGNIASRKVIEANGGVAAGSALHPDQSSTRKLQFWVSVAP